MKVTKSLLQQIIKEETKITQKQLAEKYGVKERAIYKILKRVTWKHI